MGKHYAVLQQVLAFLVALHATLVGIYLIMCPLDHTSTDLLSYLHLDLQQERSVLILAILSNRESQEQVSVGTELIFFLLPGFSMRIMLIMD